MGMYDQYEGRPRSSLMGRLAVALLIALVGLFMYWSNVEDNPITGERQHVSLSPQQEISLGLQSAPQMSREMGGQLPSSDPRVKTVQRIGQHLVDNTIARKGPWQFQFHLLGDSRTINAFALPGGQIFITLGLYNQLQNESQLAGVLGHEIGHVIERHTSEQMAKNQLGQFLVYAFGTGMSDSSSNYVMNPTMIAQFVNQIIQLRYSRKDESESDVWGIKLMEEAGYDPQAMIAVMKVLKQASGGAGGAEIFQSHPNPDLRMEQIREYLRQNPPKPGLSQGKPLN